MSLITDIAQRTSYPLMRIAMGIVLFWIGALKFADPSPVVGLLGAFPFAFLASAAVVYLLGAVEVALAMSLFAGRGVRIAGLVLMGLFAGTLAILLTSPKVAYGDAGFPGLSLAGEFLLKDLVLFAASMSLVANARQQETRFTSAAPSRVRSAA